MKQIYIIGGDMRSCYMASYFIKQGYEVYYSDAYDEDMMHQFGCKMIDDLSSIHGILILPIPVTNNRECIKGKNGNILIKDILPSIANCEIVCGGIIPLVIANECNNKNVICYDFMKDDELACKNAIATAEGAIVEAFIGKDINIDGSRSLVTGFGRCAKPLASRLKKLGSEVTIAARSDDARKEALAEGYMATDLIHMNKDADKYDFCFNTIPALVIKEDFLSKVSPDIYIIDIASMPGGIDFDYCKMHSIKYNHSLGIPGKYSPDTSGRILANAVIKKGY